MKHKTFVSREQFAAFLLATGILMMPAAVTFADDENAIEIPEQMLIISAEKWNNRQINLVGRGTKNILIYGTRRNGSFKNATLDASKTPIHIFGGYYDGNLSDEIVDVTGNVVNVNDGGDGWIFFEVEPDDSYNRLHIYDRNANDLKINLIGGRSGYGKASGNVINIYGGKLNGYVITAENKSRAINSAQNISDNTINVYNSPNLREVKLYGAAIYSDDTRERTPTFGTDNTLNFYTKNIEVTELNGFNNYNFYLPDSITHRDIVLNVIGDKLTDISGSKIFATVPQVPTIDPHEEITLIQNNQAGIEDDAKTSYIGVNNFDGTTKWQYNPVAIYDIYVDKVDADRVALGFTGRELTPPAQLIPQIRVPDFINGGGDFVSDYCGNGDFGESADIFGEGKGNWDTVTTDNVNNSDGGQGNFNGEKVGVNRTSDLQAGSQTYIPFFAMSHGSIRHKNFNTRSTHLIGGFSRKFESKIRRTFIAPMIEYGRGNFDSYMDSGEHGQGHSQYFGGGIIFRSQMSNGVFYEGSLRAGRLKNDFESNDFEVNGCNVYEKFKSNSPYIGAHFGIGRTIPIGDNEKFTYYGKILYTHTNSDDVQITSGEEIHLSRVNSERIRIGVRDSREIDPKNKIYAGLAFQYEFGGASYAEHDGLRAYAPSIRGSSGIFEFGRIIKPYGNDNLSFDLSGSGIIGKSRGLIGRCGLNWNF